MNGDLATCTASAYIQDMQFLEEFNGHDLLDQFRTLLVGQGIRFSDDKLASLLIGALPDVYRTTPGLYAPDDFRDLANGVRALAGLSALS